MAISRSARCASVAPRSSATPHSVTTLSTVFFSVVTTEPRVRRLTIRLVAPSPAVECRAMKPWPSRLIIAPFAKSAWPPEPDQ